MASKKKASEGIALLSMYNDEDDEEMDDVEEQQEEDERQQQGFPEDQQLKESEIEYREANDGMEEDYRPDARDANTPSQEDAPPRETPSGRGRLTIVDYGHDEVIMSPEREEGAVGTGGRVMFVAEHQSANGDLQVKSPPGTSQRTPQSSDLELLQPDTMGHAVIGSEAVEVEEAVNVSEESVDPLDKFLPPPPREKCLDELQRKIDKFLNLKRVGKSFNAEVRNRKDYRNPDFLLHAVRYQDIDQIGSCFGKDVFDPHGYDKSDYYEEIEADMKRERERKEQESKKNQKVEFVSGGSQPASVTAPKISLPITAVASSGLHSVPTSGDNVTREGRQNKKSKWDKVDSDRRNPLPTGGQESLSTVGAHTVILSAANAGAGYAAFAQQRRRETEEKRPSDKKLDRRS